MTWTAAPPARQHVGGLYIGQYQGKLIRLTALALSM